MYFLYVQQLNYAQSKLGNILVSILEEITRLSTLLATCVVFTSGMQAVSNALFDSRLRTFLGRDSTAHMHSTLLAIVRCLSHTDIVLKIELVFGTETNSIIRQFHYLQK